MTDRFDDPEPARSTDPEIVYIVECTELGGSAPSLEMIKTLLASTDPWAQWWSRGLPEVLQESIDAAGDAANAKWKKEHPPNNENYTPNDAYGENHNIGPAFTLPPDTVSVKATRPELPEFSYRRIGDEETISVLINDARVGPFEMVLTLSQADYVSANLYAMLKELDDIRARWAANQEGGAR